MMLIDKTSIRYLFNVFEMVLYICNQPFQLEIALKNFSGQKCNHYFIF